MWSENCTQNIFDPYLEHSSLRTGLFSDTLAHYGVKGMKWGVRKDTQYAAVNLRAARKKKIKANRDSMNAWKAEGAVRNYTKLNNAVSKRKLDVDTDAFNRFYIDSAKANKDYKKAKETFKNSGSFRERRIAQLNAATKYRPGTKAHEAITKEIKAKEKKEAAARQKKIESDIKTMVQKYNQAKSSGADYSDRHDIIFNSLKKHNISIWGFSDRKGWDREAYARNEETGESFDIDLNTGEIKKKKK